MNDTTSKTRNVILASVFTAGFAAADRLLIGPILPLISRSFHLNHAQAGAAVSFLFVSFLIVTPLGGRLGDYFSWRAVMITGLLGIGFFTGFTGLAWALYALIALRLLVGGFEGLVTASSVAWVSHQSSKKRGLYVGLWGLGVNAFIVVGLLASGYLGQSFGWRAPWIVFAIPSLIAAYLIFRFVPADTIEKQQRSGRASRPWGLVLRERNVWVCAVLGFLSTASFTSVTTWLTTFMIKIHHIDIITGSAYTAVFVVGVGLGQFTAGSVSDRLGRRRTVSLWAVLALIFLQVFLHASGFAMFLAAVCTGFFSGYLPVILSLVSDSVPSWARSTGLSVLYVGAELGAIVSPYIGGVLADRYGIYRSIDVNSLVLLVAAGVIWIAKHPSADSTVAIDIPLGTGGVGNA